MANSNLYRLHPESKTLQSVREIDFREHKFRERYDIQEWVEGTPSILGERLLIIAKEKTHFDGTNERPDLIALDKDGNLVVIELKRDDSGSDVHWQAIKYASYYSHFSVDDVFQTYADYLSKNRIKEGNEDVDTEYAKQEIVDFIDLDSAENINSRQRIILVSHRFSNEAISAVDWLFENYNLDIRCIELIPYFDEDKSTYYLQSSTILPVTGIDDYLVKPASGRAAVRKNRGSRNDDEVTKFFESLREVLLNDNSLSETNRPTKNSRWAGTDYRFRYYHFWYSKGLWDNWGISYRIWLHNKIETGDKQQKVAVKLGINPKYLLENGVTEKKLEILRKSLIELCKDSSEMTFEEDSNYTVISLFPYNQIDDQLKEKIEKRMVALIRATYSHVEEAISTK